MTQNVRTYQAHSMREALDKVKLELGADAVILGTRSMPRAGLSGIVQRERFEITAVPATPKAAPRAPRERPSPSRSAPRAAYSRPARPDAGATGVPAIPELVLPYFQELVQKEVGEDLARRIVQRAMQSGSPNGDLTGEHLRNAIRATIRAMIPGAGGIDLASGPKRVAFVGPAGAGKTTSIAKLAAHFKLRRRRSVAIISLDLHDVSRHDSIRRFAEVLDVPVHTPQTAAAARQAVRALDGIDLVLVDTAGASPRNAARMARLSTLLRAVRPDECCVVLPAWMSLSSQLLATKSVAAFKPEKLLLTHLDETVGIGVVLCAVDTLHLGLSYLSNGQNVPNDIEEVCRSRIAQLLLS